VDLFQASVWMVCIGLLGASVEIVAYYFNKKRREQQAEFDRRVNEDNYQRECRNRQWDRATRSAASRYLVGKDWMDLEGLPEFMRELYGQNLPDCLWYAFMDEKNEPLTEDEYAQICQMFWQTVRAGFGDMEVHGRVLRIRSPRVIMDGIYLPGRPALRLCQIGYATYPGVVQSGCVDLIALKPRRSVVGQN